jgi:hypothetical protein
MRAETEEDSAARLQCVQPEGVEPARMSSPLVLYFSRHQASISFQQQEWLYH